MKQLAELSKILKELRTQYGYTQKDVAKLLNGKYQFNVFFLFLSTKIKKRT